MRQSHSPSRLPTFHQRNSRVRWGDPNALGRCVGMPTVGTPADAPDRACVGSRGQSPRQPHARDRRAARQRGHGGELVPAPQFLTLRTRQRTAAGPQSNQRAGVYRHSRLTALLGHFPGSPTTPRAQPAGARNGQATARRAQACRGCQRGGRPPQGTPALSTPPSAWSQTTASRQRGTAAHPPPTFFGAGGFTMYPNTSNWSRHAVLTAATAAADSGGCTFILPPA